MKRGATGYYYVMAGSMYVCILCMAVCMYVCMYVFYVLQAVRMCAYCTVLFVLF